MLEAFPADTYLISSYQTKKSHPIVNCSSPRDRLEVNGNTASERRAIEDHDGKLTDICVLCGGKIFIEYFVVQNILIDFGEK